MLKPKNSNLKEPDIKVIPLNECLAKTIRLSSGNMPGVSVETHCRIVGLVARELLSRMPAWLREALFPKGSELIAAAHDVGKISPAFQEKIHRDIGKVLGEGVEQKEQGEILKECGVSLAQGFYYARPAPAEEALKSPCAPGHRSAC